MLLSALMGLSVISPCAEPVVQEKHEWITVMFHENAILLDVSADAKYVAAGGKGDVRVFEVSGGKEIVRVKLPDETGMVHGAFAADGKHLVALSTADGKLRYFDLANGKETKSIEVARAKGADWIVGFAPGAAHVALKVKEDIVVADAKTGKAVLELENAGPNGGGGFKQMGGAFSPDGKRFAAGAGKGRIAVWDVATGKQLSCSKGNDRDSSGLFVFVQFSPDGRFLATGHGGFVNGPIQVWDATTGELLAQPLKIEAYTTAVAWTPDGKAVATVDYNGVYATDVGTGKPVHKFAPTVNSGKLWGQPRFATANGKYMVIHAQFGSRVEERMTIYTYGVSLAQMPEVKKFPRDGELTSKELAAIWEELAEGNAFTRERYLPALAAAPGVSVPFLVKQAPVAGEKEVAYLRELIAELGSDNAKVRKTASDRLMIRAHRYEPLFRDAIADLPAGNTYDTLSALLKTAVGEPPPVDLRSELLAVELLARLNTPDAVKHLKALAAGAPQSRVTAEAKKAVEKLKAKE